MTETRSIEEIRREYARLLSIPDPAMRLAVRGPEVPTVARRSLLIAEWLRANHSLEKVAPRTLAIGRSSYPAAEFRWADRPAQRRLYVVGALPPSYRRDHRIVYVSGSEEWSVIGHGPEDPLTVEEFARYHPFGPAFLLALWNLPVPIDSYETMLGGKPWPRMGMNVYGPKVEPLYPAETVVGFDHALDAIARHATPEQD